MKNKVALATKPHSGEQFCSLGGDRDNVIVFTLASPGVVCFWIVFLHKICSFTISPSGQYPLSGCRGLR